MRRPGDDSRNARSDLWQADRSVTDDRADDPLVFETVILPARLDTNVARLVAIAAEREGVAIADLLGRAAAAYDWEVIDESPPSNRSAR